MIGRANNINNIKLNFKVCNNNIPPVVRSNNIHLTTMSSNLKTNDKIIIAKGDSGATRYYISNNDSSIFKNAVYNNTVKVNYRMVKCYHQLNKEISQYHYCHHLEKQHMY